MIGIFLKEKTKHFSLFIGLILIVTIFTAYTLINKKSSRFESSVKLPAYTSESAIELVKKYISEGHEDEIFKKYSMENSLNSKLLSKIQIGSECRKYLNKVVKEDNGLGISTIDLIDIDNDKEDEIVVYEYTGGTAGYAYISVMKKDKSGIYKFSKYPNYDDIFSIIWSKHAFIRYEGKNYYIEKEFNNSTHVFEGINIYSFNKGKIARHTFVKKYSDKLKLSTEFILGKEYNELRNRIFSEAGKVFSYLKNGDIYYGEEEKEAPEETVGRIKNRSQLVENWREADINNDLKPEFIGKGSSWMEYSRFFFIIAMSKSGNNFKEIDLHKNYSIELHNKNFSTQEFWTEKFLGKTYVTILIQNVNENICHFEVFYLENLRRKKLLILKRSTFQTCYYKVILFADYISIPFRIVQIEKLDEARERLRWRTK